VQTLVQYLPLAEMGTAQHQLKIMGLRKTIAQQLLNASKVLEQDKTKEKFTATVDSLRTVLATTIMPKSSTVRKY